MTKPLTKKRTFRNIEESAWVVKRHMGKKENASSRVSLNKVGENDSSALRIRVRLCLRRVEPCYAPLL